MLSKEATPLGDGLEILVGVVAGGSDEFAVGATECLLGYGTRNSRTSYDRCLRPFEWEGTPRAIRIELMGITNRSFGASAGKRFGSASHFIVVESRGRSLATLSLKALAGTGYPYATTADAASKGEAEFILVLLGV